MLLKAERTWSNRERRSRSVIPVGGPPGALSDRRLGWLSPTTWVSIETLSQEDEKMMTHGYARVSTNGQDLSSQEVELLAAGCAKVLKEKVSGAKTDRAELA